MHEIGFDISWLLDIRPIDVPVQNFMLDGYDLFLEPNAKLDTSHALKCALTKLLFINHGAVRIHALAVTCSSSFFLFPYEIVRHWDEWSRARTATARLPLKQSGSYGWPRQAN